MAGMSSGKHKSGGASGGRRRDSRRRRFLRRRIIAALVLVAVLAAGYFGVNWVLTRWFGTEAGSTPAAGNASLAFTPTDFLEIPGSPTRWIALGPVTDALRPTALVTGSKKSPTLIGQPVTLPDFPLAVTDLPRAKGVLVLAGQLPATGAVRTVSVGGQPALEAAGGEPSYRAWRLDEKQGLTEVNYYELAAPLTPPAPSMLLLDKWLNVLWHYEDGKLVQTFRVATGRQLQGPAPTAANQAIDTITPIGRFSIANMIPGRYYYKDQIPAGDPRNPLGTRWLGFIVYPGDNAMVWGIHGTNDPDSIGKWISDGCIRLRNPDVEALYGQVRIGTPLVIISSEPAKST